MEFIQKIDEKLSSPLLRNVSIGNIDSDHFVLRKRKSLTYPWWEENEPVYVPYYTISDRVGERRERGGEGTKEAGECEAIRSKLTIDSSETAAWHDPLPRSFPEIDDSVDVKIQSQK